MSSAVLPYALGYNDFEMRMDVGTRTDGQPVWQAFAAPFTPTSQKNWTLYRFQYTAGNMVLRSVKFKVAYDDRATELPE